MKRIYVSKRKCKSRWICENQDCRVSIDKEDSDLLEDLTVRLNMLIENPETVQAQPPKAIEPSAELRKLNAEISRILDNTNIERDVLRQKMFECVSLKYNEIDSAAYTAKRLTSYLKESAPLTAFSADFTNKTLKAAILSCSKV